MVKKPFLSVGLILQDRLIPASALGADLIKTCKDHVFIDWLGCKSPLDGWVRRDKAVLLIMLSLLLSFPAWLADVRAVQGIGQAAALKHDLQK